MKNKLDIKRLGVDDLRFLKMRTIQKRKKITREIRRINFTIACKINEQERSMQQ